MNRRNRNFLILCLLLVLFFSAAGSARAARGVPGSAAFGFGAFVYPDGPYLKEALEMAHSLDLDWIALPISWEARQPEANLPPRLETLDAVMNFAEQQGIAVMVTVSHTPRWAQTTSGPNPDYAAEFIEALANRYPTAIQAIELFPGANTRAAWGGQPSPEAYLTLYQRAQSSLAAIQHPAVLVAAGLQPVAPGAAGDMDDLAYLQQLYALGAAGQMDVISLQFPLLTGDPLLLSTTEEPRVLRHYEEVRKVMVQNDHSVGKIWVTQITPPSGTIEQQAEEQDQINAQMTGWIAQAYQQLRAQLYVGVAFLPGLNTGREGTEAQVPSLIRSQGQIDPLYTVLLDLVKNNQFVSQEEKPGKPKEGNFEKLRP